MTNILVGTTSWTEATLIESGLFYPPEVKTPEQRLRYYSQRFPIVEVDSSYYGLPSERNAKLWAQRTPQNFVFDVKAFRLFTRHQTPIDALPRDIRMRLGSLQKNVFYYDDLPGEILDELWQRFHSALDPLRQACKLGVLLFQFPPWFVCCRGSLDHITDCKNRLEGDPLAIEFRHRSWFQPERARQTLDFEKALGLVNVVVDEPQGFSGSIPCIWKVTAAKAAVVRLHGRNRQTWRKSGLTAAERFNYRYSQEELRGFVEPVRKLAQEVEKMHVLFNNCYRNHGQANALELRRLLAS